MRIRAYSLLALNLSLAWSAFAAEVSTNPRSIPKGKYLADPTHTLVTFCIRHMDLSNYCGRFNKSSAKLSFNSAQPERSSLQFTVDVTSLDTPSSELTELLKTKFFDTAQHPTATFSLSSAEIIAPGEGSGVGQLMMREKTIPIQITIKFNGGRIHPLSNAYVIGFSAKTTIAHDKFGFPPQLWRRFVGDDVSIYVEAEFVSQE